MRSFALVMAMLLSLITGPSIAPATAETTAHPSSQASAAITPTHPDYCIYSAHSIPQLDELSALLGKPITCVETFTDAIPVAADGSWDWAGWERPWVLRTRRGEPIDWVGWVHAQPGRRLILTHSLIPQGPPADWRERGAAGEFEDHARALARNLVAAGLGDAEIRLAHEPNGPWFHHYVGDTPEQQRAWATFWARTVRAMRSVDGAAFTFTLNPNAAVKPIPLANYWPGDDVVDRVGIDQYDACPGACTTAKGIERWHMLKAQPGGLDELAAFAAAHGKPVTIPELGLVDPSKLGAGDDPVFILAMRAWAVEHGAPYLSYFNKNNSGSLRLTEVPSSMLAWRAVMCSAPDGVPCV